MLVTEAMLLQAIQSSCVFQSTSDQHSSEESLLPQLLRHDPDLLMMICIAICLILGLLCGNPKFMDPFSFLFLHSRPG